MNRSYFCGRALPGFAWVAAVAVLLLLFATGGTRVNAQADARPDGQSAAGQSRGLAVPPSTPASATDIVGTWQGTLHIPKTDQHPQIDLRLVFKISRTDAGALKAVWYSIDQGSQAVPLATISFQDGVLKFTSAMVPRSYEGKMSDDGKSIAGTWMEDTTPIAMTLERANADTAWPIPEAPKPMAADAKPSFEVATIKPSQPDRPGRAFLWRGGRFITFNTTLTALIGFAYDVQDKQIVGAQDWMGTDKFDIEAKPDTPGIPSREQMRAMLQ
ncbi:MAG: TIGR03435 family protein, partial [Terriglobia bacterium]